MQQKTWKIIGGNNQIIAAAIHDGHKVRKEVSEKLAITDEARLREEDPFTAIWTEVAETRIIGLHSRFEVDLNRPREKAVYIKPEDAWGLQVWNNPPDIELIHRSLEAYDAFYADVHSLLKKVVEHAGHFVLLDIHSYNHRRNGPNVKPADVELNPEINIGTGTGMHRMWNPLIRRFIDDFQKFDFLGRHLDVRENIRFQGGYFSRWIHQSFPKTGCAIAIEFKKIFMDEWTGRPDNIIINAMYQALQSTIEGINSELRKLSKS